MYTGNLSKSGMIHNLQCIETYSFETKRQDHFRSKIESEKTFATSPADTEQTSNKGKITNRKASFFMGASKKLSSLWGI